MVDDVLRDAAVRALADWDINVKSVDPLPMSENIVFKITAQNGSAYVLRLHRPGYHTLNELISEQRWAAALLDAGLDVPVPRTTRSGQAYTSIDLGDEHRYVGLLEWVDGVPMQALIECNQDLGFMTQSFLLLGQIMAECHNQAVSWTIPEQFRRHSFDADGLMGEMPFWGRFWEAQNATTREREKLSLIRNNMTEILSKLPKDINSFGMIHADLHSQNVLIQGKSLSVIDFDDSGFGWYGFDLAVAIWDRLDFTATGCHFDIAYKSLIRGYLEERPNAKDIIETIPTFLLMRTLMIIRWIEDRPESGYEAFIPVLIQASIDQAKQLELLD